MAVCDRRFMVLRIFLLAAFIILSGLATNARGQESGSLEPVAGSAAESELSPQFALDPDIPIVVELFSSQACIFCPQADRLFGDLARQPSIIGLACHVDYFDVRKGSLAQPFCTERQNWYVDKLGTGPNYTPQIIMQGNIDVVGYRMKDVVIGLQQASEQATVRLDIKADETVPFHFDISLPSWAGPLPPGSMVWLVKFDKPHKLEIATGRNAGQRMSYYNIASALLQLESWKGISGRAEVELEERHAGFAVLIHNPVTGRIIAAGQYRISQQAQ